MPSYIEYKIWFTAILRNQMFWRRSRRTTFYFESTIIYLHRYISMSVVRANESVWFANACCGLFGMKTDLTSKCICYWMRFKNNVTPHDENFCNWNTLCLRWSSFYSVTIIRWKINLRVYYQKYFWKFLSSITWFVIFIECMSSVYSLHLLGTVTNTSTDFP